MAKPSPSHSGDPALVSLGAAVRALRHEKNISQETLAHEAGVDRSYMGGIERGEHNPTVMNLLRICQGLKVPLSALAQRALL